MATKCHYFINLFHLFQLFYYQKVEIIKSLKGYITTSEQQHTIEYQFQEFHPSVIMIIRPSSFVEYVAYDGERNDFTVIKSHNEKKSALSSKESIKNMREGIKWYKDMGIYVGQLKDDTRHGKGKMTYVNGIICKAADAIQDGNNIAIGLNRREVIKQFIQYRFVQL